MHKFVIKLIFQVDGADHECAPVQGQSRLDCLAVGVDKFYDDERLVAFESKQAFYAIL